MTGCALFGSVLGGDKAAEQQAQQAQRQQAADQRAAEQAAALQEQDDTLQAEIEAAWKEIDAEGATSARALALVELTTRAFTTGAVQREHVDGVGLTATTIEHIDEALAAEPEAAADLQLAKGKVQVLVGDGDAAVAAYQASFAAREDKQTFLEMLALGRSPAIDGAVASVCPTARPMMSDEEVPDFVEACLGAVGGDRKALKWKGIKKDFAAHRVEMERRAEEAARLAAEEAKRAAEEAERAAEEAKIAAEEAAKSALYTVAAVFAAGDCSFGDCMHKGWEIRTDDGTIRVSCNFGDCLAKGWEARFPDGGTARTSCNFGECMQKGWETRFPDGETARTSCNFGECATKGWETRLPSGDTARTSCNFGECYTKGWETRLPDGSSVRCSCNFGDCLQKGTDCR